MKKFTPLFAALLCCCAPLAHALSDAALTARDAAREYGAAVRNCDMGWALDFMYPPLKRSYADRMSARGDEAERDRAQRIMGMAKESEEQARRRLANNMKALRAKYVRMGRNMRAAGFKVESFSVGAPTAEYVVNPPTEVVRTVVNDRRGAIRAEDIQDGRARSRFVVLPTILVCSMPDAKGDLRRIQRNGCIFAVRDEVLPGNANDRGTQLNKWYFIDGETPVSQLRAYFPNLPLNLKMPPCGDKPLN